MNLVFLWEVIKDICGELKILFDETENSQNYTEMLDENFFY